MEIVCDYRENHVIKQLNNCININKEKYNCMNIKKENLLVGDFQIGNMIFERKTHQDLASSILDGRYQEQSNRLMEHASANPHLKIIYIVEGNLDLYFNQHNIDKDKIISCIMSLFYEKGFQVLLTKHVNETSDYLLKFCIKYYTKYLKKNTNNDLSNNDLSNNDLSNNICNIINICGPKKKSSQINKENIGILMLSNIPNISIHIATQLLKPFNHSLYDFLYEIKNNAEYLNTLKIESKDKKMRKLSKNIIENLNSYFCI